MSVEVRAGYKQTEAGLIPEDWSSGTLGQFISLRRGHDLTQRDRRNGNVPVMGSAGQNGFHNVALATGPGVTLGRSGASYGQAHYCDVDYWPHNTALYVTDFQGNDPLYIFYFLKNTDFSSHNTGGAQQSLNRNFIYPIPVALPKINEQKQIANALSDIDALITHLDQLIAKKRDIQQAAMQQLLTGQRRLPGFSGEWAAGNLGDISFISKGEQLSRKGNATGSIPHFNGGVSASSYTDTANTPKDTIAISEGGNSCGHVQFITTPFWCGGHCYSIQPRGIENLYLYFALKGKQDRIMGLRVGSGLPNIQKSALSSFQIFFPSCRDEQTAIATLLSDMDTELTALQTRRHKARQIKQGMMQELLTGRIRLI